VKIAADSTLSRGWLALAALAALSLGACAGTATMTIGQAIKEIAPDYRARAPATGSADLGRPLLADQPETNACFNGDPGTATPSWTRLVLSYGDVLDGKLHRPVLRYRDELRERPDPRHQGGDARRGG
jgi:hypothetical protein